MWSSASVPEDVVHLETEELPVKGAVDVRLSLLAVMRLAHQVLMRSSHVVGDGRMVTLHRIAVGEDRLILLASSRSVDPSLGLATEPLPVRRFDWIATDGTVRLALKTHGPNPPP
jgi:hypothetical protein